MHVKQQTCLRSYVDVSRRPILVRVCQKLAPLCPLEVFLEPQVAFERPPLILHLALNIDMRRTGIQSEG